MYKVLDGCLHHACRQPSRSPPLLARMGRVQRGKTRGDAATSWCRQHAQPSETLPAAAAIGFGAPAPAPAPSAAASAASMSRNDVSSWLRSSGVRFVHPPPLLVRPPRATWLAYACDRPKKEKIFCRQETTNVQKGKTRKGEQVWNKTDLKGDVGIDLHVFVGHKKRRHRPQSLRSPVPGHEVVERVGTLLPRAHLGREFRHRPVDRRRQRAVLPKPHLLRHRGLEVRLPARVVGLSAAVAGHGHLHDVGAHELDDFHVWHGLEHVGPLDLCKGRGRRRKQ